MAGQGARRRRVWTAALLFGVVGGMVGLSFAAVPLYRMFCQATGYAGTPKTKNIVPPDRIAEETVTVQFDANVNPALPWRFKPEQRQVTIRLGEETLVHYTAANRSDADVTGTATFNVTPDKAASYFSKIDCFCFTEQTLAPGQEVSMPVVFFVDPALATDPNAWDVKVITLSYTFFRVGNERQAGGNAGVAVARGSGNNS
jgi:cytochrome c oxidase assembly protein subunit 11